MPIASASLSQEPSCLLRPGDYDPVLGSSEGLEMFKTEEILKFPTIPTLELFLLLGALTLFFEIKKIVPTLNMSFLSLFLL